MIIWFWSIIVLLTLAAWGCCLVWPLYHNAAAKISVWAKAGLIGFPVVVIGLYLLFGDSHQLQQFWVWQRQNEQVQQELAKLKNPQELIDRLRDHLRQDPQSAEGWYLLGKLYLDQRQYANAEPALNRAHQLQPQAADVILALAKADFFNHGQHLTPAMEAMLTHVLESLTEPVDGLNLLAVNAYRHKDFRQAVRYWQRALALTPPDSPDSRILLDMISQAQQQKGN